MATTINRATLARQVNGEIEYIYPKTHADLVEYDANQNVKEKIDSIASEIDNIDPKNKVNKPVDEDGAYNDGKAGQTLESNGDGTTSWVNRARVYVGDGEMPEGYDVQIDPTETAITIDRSLAIDGAVAESSAVGAAIENAKKQITKEIKTHDEDAAAHIDIRAMITDPKDYVLMKDAITGELYKLVIENGEIKCNSTVVKCISIEVTTLPTKTSYGVKELFDPEGMIVTALYSDGTTREVTGYTYPTTGLTIGTTSVPIYYIEGGVTLHADLPITVTNKRIGVTIAVKPNKVLYTVGETFDPTGMDVRATYSDGTTKSVSFKCDTKTPLTMDATFVVITNINGEEAYTLNLPITVTEFDHVSVLQDFTYEDNGDGTYTITGWKGTKNGIISSELVVPDDDHIIVNPSV